MADSIASEWGLVLGQIVAAAIVALMNAVLLRWRALKMRKLAINFRAAYWISFKASLAAFVFSDFVVIGLAFLAPTNPQLVKNAMSIAAMVGWFLVHSHGVLKFGNSTLTRRDALAISVSVFVFGLLVGIACGLVVVAILAGVAKLSKP
jgi:hypothetical protein